MTTARDNVSTILQRLQMRHGDSSFVSIGFTAEFLLRPVRPGISSPLPAPADAAILPNAYPTTQYVITALACCFARARCRCWKPLSLAKFYARAAPHALFKRVWRFSRGARRKQAEVLLMAAGGRGMASICGRRYAVSPGRKALAKGKAPLFHAACYKYMAAWFC